MTAVKMFEHPFLIEDTPGVDLDNTIPALREGMMHAVETAIDEADLGRLA
jgi:predicted GTPase